MKTCEPSLTVSLCTFMPCLYVTFQELLGCVLELTLSATGPDFSGLACTCTLRFCLNVAL